MINSVDDRLLVILGPTASGKTRIAVLVASILGGEILSADSRQIYQGMDIGTGKDLTEYHYQGKDIPYHLIDIVPAGERYNVYRYMKDFYHVYREVKKRGAVPLLCGGSGLYIEAVCQGFDMPHVPENKELRLQCASMGHQDLIDSLASYSCLHNTTDTQSRKRLIRAIEIAAWKQSHPFSTTDYPKIHPELVGLCLPVDERRARIDQRLELRLKNGMIEEAERLMIRGLTVDDMVYYGLEYKYLAHYRTGMLSFAEMKQRLRFAIHQFAKRQMTWFRGMERRGLSIRWIDVMLPENEIVKKVLSQ